MLPSSDLYPSDSLYPSDADGPPPPPPPPQRGTVAGVRLVTADDVCHAIEDVLRQHLPAWAHAAGLAETPQPQAKGQVRVWDQVPDATLISQARLPAGVIASPGLSTGAAATRRGGVLRWDATYRVGVAVYDRGRSFEETQSRCRRWAGLLATVVLAHPRLDGLSTSIAWVDQQTEPNGDPSSSRTFAQAIAVFDVTCEDVLPLGAAPPNADGTIPDRPTVTRSTVSMVTSVTTRPPLTSASPF